MFRFIEDTELDFVCGGYEEPRELGEAIYSYQEMASSLGAFELTYSASSDPFGWSLHSFGTGVPNLETYFERMQIHHSGSGVYMDCTQLPGGDFHCSETGNPTADQMLFKANLEKMFDLVSDLSADARLKIAHAFTDKGVDSTNLNVLQLLNTYKNSGGENSAPAFADWVKAQGN
jgi:hypothetical protein